MSSLPLSHQGDTAASPVPADEPVSEGPIAPAADDAAAASAPEIAAPAAPSRPSVRERAIARAAVALRPVVGLLRSAVVVGMFFGAAAAGVYFYGAQTQPMPRGEYPTQPTVPEPPAAHSIVELVVADDAVGLSKALEAEALEALAGALRTIEPNPQPLVEVTDVKYLGAVNIDDQTVVSYLANGRDAAGTTWVVGFALRVQGDSVVGVN